MEYNMLCFSLTTKYQPKTNNLPNLTGTRFSLTLLRPKDIPRSIPKDKREVATVTMKKRRAWHLGVQKKQAEHLVKQRTRLMKFFFPKTIPNFTRFRTSNDIVFWTNMHFLLLLILFGS